MAYIYKQSDLLVGIDSIVAGKSGILGNPQDLMNRAVRSSFGDIDLRAAKRKSQLSPGLYGDVNTYLCPVDIKNQCIIDLERQVSEFGLGGQYPRREEFELTTAEEFSRKKIRHRALLAFDDHDQLRTLLVSTRLNTQYTVIDPMTSVTDNGTWSVTTGTNLRQNFSNFLYGNSSIAFDTAANFTTASIQNSTLTLVNLANFTANELFFYVYCPVVVGLSSFTLTWGNSASSYWTQTVTATHENLAFSIGWNTLRFEWPAGSTGSPNSAAITYAQITVTSTGTIAAAVGWSFTYLVARIGDIHNMVYYTKYGWIDGSTGAYKENSTSADDILVADTDEFDLIVARAGIPASQELRFTEAEKQGIATAYTTMRDTYVSRYPSERKILTNTAYEFGSINGDDDSRHSDWSPGTYGEDYYG